MPSREDALSQMRAAACRPPLSSGFAFRVTGHPWPARDEGDFQSLDPVSPAIHGLHGMRASCPHLTPCIRRLIKGDTRKNSTAITIPSKAS